MVVLCPMADCRHWHWLREERDEMQLHGDPMWESAIGDATKTLTNLYYLL